MKRISCAVLLALLLCSAVSADEMVAITGESFYILIGTYVQLYIYCNIEYTNRYSSDNFTYYMMTNDTDFTKVELFVTGPGGYTRLIFGNERTMDGMRLCQLIPHAHFISMVEGCR